ncbi:MAG: hypothetical protein ACI4NC_11380 [Succinivibrio sp.]
MNIKLKRNILLDGVIHYEDEVVTTSDANANKLISVGFATTETQTNTESEVDNLINKLPNSVKKTTGKK